MTKALVVLSGGLDSSILLHKICKEYDEVEAVSFNYGSKHNNKEFRYAQWQCEFLKVGNTRIELPLDKHFKSDLLQSGGDIPEGHYAQSNMKKTVVPFRNGIMLAVAVGFAESIGAQTVALGNHFGDHAVYPDCRKSFIKPFAEEAEAGTYEKIKLLSPFASITKTDIVKLGDSLQVPMGMTYSCYKGGNKQCGRCSTCFERREAFHEAEVKDETMYEDSTPIATLIKEYGTELDKDKK